MDGIMLSSDAPRVPRQREPHFSARSPGPGRLRQAEMGHERLAQHKVGMLTFQEVVRYFTENRPTDRRVAGGALLRRRGITSSQYVQVFVDARDQPLADTRGAVYGRVIRADQVDDALAAAFGRRGNDLVIFR